MSSFPLKTFSVQFTDTTVWRARIKAANAEAAIEDARNRWDDAATEGFASSHALHVATDGTDDWQAEEVQQ